MTTYAIGDVQGCLTPLKKLLDHIKFDNDKDSLWFTGDLVNRGPDSLGTLRFIKALGNKHRIVLGNHDLHLLAVAHDAYSSKKGDTFSEILAAPDRKELIDWLCQQPLLHHEHGYTMVHAGLAPSWDLTAAQQLANEVQSVLHSDNRIEFFRHMYGNEPNYWKDSLTGFERLRAITNHFTRIRFCYPDGSIELGFKGKVDTHPEKLIPWFQMPDRKNADVKIIFGHWAALGGITNTPNTFALDTGCVWGFSLTAMRLEDGKRFCVGC